MRHTKFLCVALAIGGLVGCMSMEKRGARVEIEIQEEKLVVVIVVTDPPLLVKTP